MVSRVPYIHDKALFERMYDFGASFEMSGVALSVGHASCVLKRSVLLISRIVSSIVLISKQGACFEIA